MSERRIITNCRLFDAEDANQTTCILIENGVISEIGQVECDAACENVLDAQGRIVAPGFIDVHIQGAGGADVLDGTAEALAAMSKTCARFGTTGFLATTVFKPSQGNQHLAFAAEAVGRDLGGANLLGIHLEGPFISLQKRGMILPECICPPSQQALNDIQAVTAGQLRMMTIAPELPGSLPIVRSLIKSRIIASFGHSSATYEQTIEGFNAGISHVTHLFNAMTPIHHRAPGPLPAIFESHNVTAQLITDGVHIHPAILRLTLGALGLQRTIVITDGMQAIGLGDGRFTYNGVEYESKAGTARYKDGTLIGTALGLNQMVAKFMAFTGCPLAAAIRTVTENPARLLGLEKKGTIAPGKEADLVLLEEDLSVAATLVAGKTIFEK